MTLDSLLAEVLSLGWYVYSVGDEGPHCTWSSFRWHCTLRLEAGPASKIARGRGHSLTESINSAINSIPEATIVVPQSYSIETKPAIADVLAKLIKPSQPIKRRI